MKYRQGMDFEGLTIALCRRAGAVWLMEDPDFVNSCQLGWEFSVDIGGYCSWFDGFLKSMMNTMGEQRIADKVTALRIVRLAKEGNRRMQSACLLAGIDVNLD